MFGVQQIHGPAAQTGFNPQQVTGPMPQQVYGPQGLYPMQETDMWSTMMPMIMMIVMLAMIMPMMRGITAPAE